MGRTRPNSLAPRQTRKPRYPWAPFFALLILVTAAFGFLRSAEPLDSGANSGQPSPAGKVTLTPETEVLAYVEGREVWRLMPFRNLKRNQEFLYQEHLCYVDRFGKVQMNLAIDISMLPEADRAFDRDYSRFPEPREIVRFIAEDRTHLRHERMGTARAGDSFVFQGRLYDVVSDRNSRTGISLRKTDMVLSPVVSTSAKQASSVVELTITDEKGRDSVITGTPEHPFYVPAVKHYVAMGQLAPGTVLETSDGSYAEVKGSTLQHEEKSVYNFEVEGTHNYFVASTDDGPSILVHNACAGGGHLRSSKTIKFSQNNVSSRFSDKRTLNEMVAMLKGNPASAAEIEPILISKLEDLPMPVKTRLLDRGASRSDIFAVTGNRRLLAARLARSKVNARFATLDELSAMDLTERFSTTTAGRGLPRIR